MIDKERRSKDVYWMTFWICYLTAIVLFPSITPRSWHSAMGGISVGFIFLSRLMAGAVCRRMGLDVSRTEVEPLQPRQEQEMESLPDRIELKPLQSLLMWMATIMGLIFLVILIVVPIVPAVPGTQKDGYYLAGLFGGSSLVCWLLWWARRRNFDENMDVLVDRSGAMGRSQERFGAAKGFVAWDQVHSAEVVTQRGVIGEVIKRIAVFKNDTGEVVLELKLSGASTKDAQRISNFISRKLAEKQTAS